MAIITAVLLILGFSVATSIPLLSQPVDGTACDWNVWDDTTEEKSVQKIAIRCSEGQVTWRTPYGGLAMTFFPPLESQFYELCFVAEASFATVQLFLEGNQSLSHLAVLNGSRSTASRSSSNREICLNSTSAQSIVIFAETDSANSSPVLGKMVFDYDVRVIKPSTSDQDCSPCGEETILLAACTSDYAVVGQIHSVSESHDSGKTDIHVLVSKVVRQRYKVVKDFLDVHGDQQHQNLFHHQPSPLLQSHHLPSDSATSRQKKGTLSSSEPFSFDQTAKDYGLTIVVPSKCRVRHGQGVFLFLGSIRLKKARLECAPRLEEFERIWENAVATGNNMCTFK